MRQNRLVKSVSGIEWGIIWILANVYQVPEERSNVVVMLQTSNGGLLKRLMFAPKLINRRRITPAIAEAILILILNNNNNSNSCLHRMTSLLIP